MIAITDRDKEIKKFLKEVTVADTKTLHTLFFTGTTMRNCQKRLKQLVDARFIKCYRQNIISQNVYFLRKPRNIPHKIKFSQLLAEIKLKNIELLKYRTPFAIGNLIADGLIIIQKHEEIKIYFVEVERTKKLDVKKYLDLYYSRAYKEKFPTMPSILVIGKKPQENNVLDIVHCDWNLENIKEVIL